MELRVVDTVTDTTTDWGTQHLNVNLESIKGTKLREFTPVQYVQVLSRRSRANWLLVKDFQTTRCGPVKF